MGEKRKAEQSCGGKKFAGEQLGNSFPFLRERGHVVSFVGAGGKTTLMYAFAGICAGNGLRTLVTTTTHIFEPDRSVRAEKLSDAERLWEAGSYAVVGASAENGKIRGLPEEELRVYTDRADMVLIEADGAKRMPCKVPAVHEPVIPEECDIVVGVMGMSAVGRPLGEVCFRLPEALRLLNASFAPSELMREETMIQGEQFTPETPLTPWMAAEILASGEGTRKHVGERSYYVALNQCDSAGRVRAGEEIRRILKEKGIGNCVLTAFPDRA